MGLPARPKVEDRIAIQARVEIRIAERDATLDRGVSFNCACIEQLHDGR